MELFNWEVLQDIYSTSIFYFFVVFLMGLIILYSNIKWYIKALVIVVSIAFVSSFYFIFIDKLGRPTVLSMPTKFEYVTGMIKRPNPSLKDPGNITMIIKDEEDYRMYRIPYDEKMAKAMRKATRMHKKSKGAKVKMEIPNAKVMKKPNGREPKQEIKVKLIIPKSNNQSKEVIPEPEEEKPVKKNEPIKMRSNPHKEN